MRCSSTVSAPVQHCCAPLTAHYSRYIGVQLLTNEVLYFVAETKSKAKDVYARTCIYLGGRGMLDCELFGLAIMYDGEYLFVDPESKLSKYAPKNWKSSSSYGLDGHGKPTFMLHLRVQFYVDTPTLLRDEITRHNYYLQLRDNTLTRGQMTLCSSDELLFLLAGYALQADYGDYSECNHGTDYFQIDKYFPKELITKNKHVFQTAIALHKDNRGLTAAEAEMQYIREASSNEISLLSHNLHLYKLRSHKKQNADQSAVWLAICARGIQIYEETHFKKPASTSFSWNNIGKLCFDRKKFEIKALSPFGDKMTYYTNSDEKSKHLLLLCRVTHQFSMSIQAKLAEIKKQEVSDDLEIREITNVTPGDSAESLTSFNSEVGVSQMFNGNPGSIQSGEKIDKNPAFPASDIGIRMNSLRTDRSTDDSSSRCSTGNMTRADSLAVLSTDSNHYLPAGTKVQLENNRLRRNSTGSDAELNGNRAGKTGVVFGSASRRNLNFCVRNVRENELGGPEENRIVEPGKAGIVYGMPKNYERLKLSNYGLKKSHGTKSDSSELSVVSDADEKQATNRLNDFTSEADCKSNGRNDELESSQENVGYSELSQRHASNVSDLETSSSGVYTSSNDLNSENVNGIVPTMSSTAESDLLTNVCSSETSELYDINELKTIEERKGSDDLIRTEPDPMRKRSGSNTSEESEPESFCGDGSDRLDGVNRTLLTADELSDLIVGKTHISGTYPSKATVSNTLDSDSDYVTLPFPTRYSSDSNKDLEELSSFSSFSNNQYGKNTPKVQKKMSFLSISNSREPKETFDTVDAPAPSVTTAPTDQNDRILKAAALRSCALPREEANARFITTKPHVSMITHSNVPSASLTPNYACPTVSSIQSHIDAGVQPHADNLTHSNAPIELASNPYERHSYSGDILSILKRDFSATDWERKEKKNFGKISSSTSNLVNGELRVPAVPMLPVVGKNNYLDIHASKTSHYAISPRDTGGQQQNFYPLNSLTCIPSQFPTNAAPVTVYTSQVTSSQIEQFKQQLYSDVDYVVYPMKDPAISKQEYIDAKKCSLLSAMASAYPQLYPPPPPPPYPRVETRFLCRSTPNVAADENYAPHHMANRFSREYSSQNRTGRKLSEYQSHTGQYTSRLSFSNNPSSCLVDYSSPPTQNFRREPLHLTNYYARNRLSDIPGKSLTLSRTQSDDNILNSHQDQRSSFPAAYPYAPPTPSLPSFFSYKKRFGVVDSKTKFGKTLVTTPVNGKLSLACKGSGDEPGVRTGQSSLSSTRTADTVGGDRSKIIDIRALIEKSKNLDLPLISALCNDKSLLCQTNAFVMPKHPNSGPQPQPQPHSPGRLLKNSKRTRKKSKLDKSFTPGKTVPVEFPVKSSKPGQAYGDGAVTRSSRSVKSGGKGPTLLEAIFSVKSSKASYASSKLKYPVSGLSTSQISKSHKKKSCIHSAHVHPENSEAAGGNETTNVRRPLKTHVKTSSAINSTRALVP